MDVHHVCIVVRNTDEYVKFWCDVMGWKIIGDTVLPDPYNILGPKVVDDIFASAGGRNFRTRCVTIVPGDGGNAAIELEQPLDTPLALTLPDNLRYKTTGMHEYALRVKDIDEWFKKIRAAGYKTTTEYVWESGENAGDYWGGKSFLFYDPEGNMIQLFETRKPDSSACVTNAAMPKN